MNKYVEIGGVVGELQKIDDIRLYSEAYQYCGYILNFIPKYIVTIIEKDTGNEETYYIHDLSEIKEVSE